MNRDTILEIKDDYQHGKAGRPSHGHESLPKASSGKPRPDPESGIPERDMNDTQAQKRQ